MIKKALEYLVSLKGNRTYEINGETYSDQDLVRIDPIVYRPNSIRVSGLDSLIQLVKKEAHRFEKLLPIYVRVMDEHNVEVFTSYDHEMKRSWLYTARCEVPGFSDGFRNQEVAIIQLRSKFMENEGTAYLLDLLSRISKENGVTTNDNGVSQEVVARAGVSLKTSVAIKPRVVLKPYRTFQEVDQPASEFLFRLDEKGDVGLFEADGGMWKLKAKENIQAHLASGLQDEINNGSVVVMM